MSQDIQQSARDRTVMLAGISHDLRTPLTRLRLTAEMMGDKDLAEGMILDIQDMDAILEQFISFMRDGSEEHFEPADLNQILSEISAQFASQVAVVFEPVPLPNVRMKRMAVKRMIGNLVNNALRYGRGPVELAAELGRNDVTVTVRDHGSGVDESRIPELLQPFVRGEGARTTQGTGLGLAIVTRIVTLHRGTLALRNHPEGGLEATVRLPLSREA